MRAGAGTVGHQPGVGVPAAGGNCVVVLVHTGGVVGVRRPLAGFRVEDPVGVHAVGNPAAVAEDDFYGVADLGVDRGPQQAQVRVLWRARCQRGEAGVSVATVEAFHVSHTDPSRTGLEEGFLLRTEGLAGDVVAVVRGVVPHDLVGTDVVGAHAPSRVEGLAGDLVPVRPGRAGLRTRRGPVHTVGAVRVGSAVGARCVAHRGPGGHRGEEQHQHARCGGSPDVPPQRAPRPIRPSRSVWSSRASQSCRSRQSGRSCRSCRIGCRSPATKE